MIFFFVKPHIWFCLLLREFLANISLNIKMSEGPLADKDTDEVKLMILIVGYCSTHTQIPFIFKLSFK